METIRDEATFGLMMIPLFVEWGVKRCNIKDCTNRPSTIIRYLCDDAPLTGWCEEHYQQFKTEGRFEGTLVFDDFDAFTKVDPPPKET